MNYLFNYVYDAEYPNGRHEFPTIEPFNVPAITWDDGFETRVMTTASRI